MEVSHSSPTLSAARASIATISGSVSGTADRPEGGSGAESSSPDRSGSPSDAAIDIRSSGGAPKDTSGTPLGGPASSLGSSTGCEVPVERGALEGWFLGGEIPHRHRKTSPATARSSAPPAAARGSPRSRQRHGHPAPLAGNGVWSATPRRSFSRTGSMTRPRKPPQRA